MLIAIRDQVRFVRKRFGIFEVIGGSEESGGALWTLFTFFALAGAFVFGSGLAMITPGPVVIKSGFIGFLVADLAGACVASLGTLLPCYAFVVVAAPAFRKYGKRPANAAFVKGVKVAAIGAITGAVVVLGRRTITDVPTMVLALVTLSKLGLSGAKKIGKSQEG